MVSYDLPIKIGRLRGGYSIAVAVNDQVVVSRQLSRADLVQLQVLLAEVLDERPPPPPVREVTAQADDDFLFDVDG